MLKSFLFKDKEVKYQKLGSAETVIMLVHGFPEDGSIFKYQYEFLQENYTVLIPDLPGSGKSYYNEELKSVEDFAMVLEGILKEEEVGQCFLLGHSMGGYIALAFAEKFPEQLLGLGLIHSTAFADSEEKKENRKHAIQIMEQYGSFQFLRTVIPTLFGEQFKVHHPAVIEQLVEQGKNFETKALQQYYAIMILRPDRSNVLKEINVPVLFIIGQLDKVVPPTDVLQQIALPNTAMVKILPNAAHMGFLEERTIVNIAIEEFTKLQK
jgi:pimeloyl-ACP methyl ester carboxylesterase